jgi:ABC-2 type transport system ATP-binding protein
VRLAFSLAICAEADILLVDEVLAVGDADFQRKCYDYFRNLKKNNKTVVFVSHDMNAVREYCDKAILIENGKIAASGSPNDVAAEYTKLFSESMGVESGDSKRWGKAGEIITKVSTTPTKISQNNEELHFTATVKVHERMEEPIIGYVIKNAVGDSLTGTNTKLLGIKTGVYEAGESFTVNWTLPNVFADGKYQIDVAVIDNDGITVQDWWESASKFTVFEENPSPYSLSPKVTTKITKA